MNHTHWYVVLATRSCTDVRMLQFACELSSYCTYTSYITCISRYPCYKCSLDLSVPAWRSLGIMLAGTYPCRYDFLSLSLSPHSSWTSSSRPTDLVDLWVFVPAHWGWLGWVEHLDALAPASWAFGNVAEGEGPSSHRQTMEDWIP